MLITNLNLNFNRENVFAVTVNCVRQRMKRKKLKYWGRQKRKEDTQFIWCGDHHNPISQDTLEEYPSVE